MQKLKKLRDFPKFKQLVRFSQDLNAALSDYKAPRMSRMPKGVPERVQAHLVQ